MKNFSILLTVLLLFSIMVFGCSKNNEFSWEGTYSFEELSPSAVENDMYIMRVYNINIYENNNEMIASIDVNGFQVTEEIEAKVVGNDKSIDLVFSSDILNNSKSKTYKEGDILISFFINDNGEIITKWGELKPMNILNNEMGDYFKKT